MARFGLRDGMDAASDAIEYAITHWDRVATLDNPTGYLFKVARSKAARSIRRSPSPCRWPCLAAASPASWRSAAAAAHEPKGAPRNGAYPRVRIIFPKRSVIA